MVSTAEIMKGTDKHITLSQIRKSIIVLLDVCDEHEANKKLAAARVMQDCVACQSKLSPQQHLDAWVDGGVGWRRCGLTAMWVGGGVGWRRCGLPAEWVGAGVGCWRCGLAAAWTVNTR